MIKCKNNLPFDEYLEILSDIHDKIKEHPFRKNFTDRTLIGTWKSQLREYKNLIYDSTEVLCYMAYGCKDSPITPEDTQWVHDFRNAAFVIDYYFLEKLDEGYFKKRLASCNMTPEEIYEKTGANDINMWMLFFEKYIGYIHQFIETKQLNKICGIKYEKVTEPHNGHYYKHFVEFEKVDGKWQLVEEPDYIGTIPRLTDKYGD